MCPRLAVESRVRTLRQVCHLHHRRMVDHAVFFFSSRRRHTRLQGDWSSEVCSSDLTNEQADENRHQAPIHSREGHEGKVAAGTEHRRRGAQRARLGEPLAGRAAVPGRQDLAATARARDVAVHLVVGCSYQVPAHGAGRFVRSCGAVGAVELQTPACGCYGRWVAHWDLLRAGGLERGPISWSRPQRRNQKRHCTANRATFRYQRVSEYRILVAGLWIMIPNSIIDTDGYHTPEA